MCQNATLYRPSYLHTHISPYSLCILSIPYKVMPISHFSNNMWLSPDRHKEIFWNKETQCTIENVTKIWNPKIKLELVDTETQEIYWELIFEEYWKQDSVKKVWRLILKKKKEEDEKIEERKEKENLLQPNNYIWKNGKLHNLDVMDWVVKQLSKTWK